MTSFRKKKLSPTKSSPANGLASQSTQQQPPRHQPFPYRSQSTSQSHQQNQQNQQSQPVCIWSAHASPFGPSPSPFPRSSHALTATATAAGELFLFGGYAHGSAKNDLHLFSTRDFSTTLLETSGEVPSPRTSHGAALASNNLLVWGGITNFRDRNVPNRDQDGSLYILDLVSREWTRVVVNGPGPNGRPYHTTTVVGSKLFVFGGRTYESVFNDMWALDLNCQSQPVWESYEPAPWNEEPLPRSGHVSVTTENRIIIFGGTDDQHSYNDTWSFDISTRTWTELQCTGSIPSPRSGHAAVLVDDVMYVFGGFSADKAYLDDLIALHLSTLRWFKFHNVGPSPHGRSSHAMASDGTRVFVLGGYSEGARADEVSLIHVFDTKHIKYPEHELNAVNPNKRTTQLAWKSSTGSPTQEQPQHTTASLSEYDVNEGSSKYHVKFAAPYSSSEGEVARLENERFMELKRQPLVSLAAQTERDKRIAQLTDELALKSSLLEQAEANAAETTKRAGLELDRPLMQTSMVNQNGHGLVDMQAKLEELPLSPSRDQQFGQYGKKLANIRAKLVAKESELEAIRLRLTDAEKGWTKSKAEADTLRAEIAAGLVNTDEDRIVRRLTERMRVMVEAEMASLRRKEKSRESI
ncbi:hypothetical protein F5888DRAFT_1929890 [Russula emetica]|nr:hypothetical protein F5888DRAFT_1929890 [Russula emetica]